MTRVCNMQVWDIATSVHRPAAAHAAPEGTAVTCLAFAPTAPVLAAGESSGAVAAYRLHDLPRDGDAPDAAAARLDAALLANTVRRVPGGG